MEDVPGVTRDRVAYDAEWAGRRFTLWTPAAGRCRPRASTCASPSRPRSRSSRRRRAVRRRCHRRRDRHRRGRRCGSCAVRAALSSSSRTRWTMRVPRPTPRCCGRSGSASRGRSRPCTDAVPATCSTPSWGCFPRCPGCRRTPAAGRGGSRWSAGPMSASPGCSTVSPAASRWSSTRSPAPPATPWTSSSSFGGQTWRFVDTAGIRRRVRQTRGADFYASLRTQTALEKAEVAVVLIDGEERIAEQDIRVVSRWSTPGAPSCSRSTSGTCWTRSAVTTWNARSTRPPPRRLGAAGEHLRAHRPPHGPPRPRDGALPGRLGAARLDRPAERLPR